MFKCFKMQITTGFKFSLPPLVKTKGEVGLPKSPSFGLFFWGLGPAGTAYGKEWGCGWPRLRLREPAGLRGRAKPQPRGGPVARARRVKWQEGCLRRGASVSFLSTVIWGSGEAQQRAASLYKCQGFPTPGVQSGWGAPGWRPQRESFGGLCPVVTSWAGDAQCVFFCPSYEILRSSSLFGA